PGRHNLANTLAALGLLIEMGFDPQILSEGLASFAGVKRRQEVIGCPGGILVVDDFAHHPTAVNETLAALKEFYPGRRLVAVFEPRTNTSRRSFFQADYPRVFGAADLALIRQASRLADIPPGERFSSKKLVADLKARGQAAFFFEKTEPILDFLAQEARPGDLVAILSNGGFDGLQRRLLKALGQKYET
ncbi:MAG: UDP-N-acetylmuramate:L-alanyl-gamma-D-glutamyl-meso-diaminopimelate ligase, partial [Deltaproteobacteria bacterium]|nr:UDP-N-acetylmuramate:L-alanyl-gamma-D-glutamyl-meso-diaminopimelate ligase [Deltaproteobacteria bacterium]